MAEKEYRIYPLASPTGKAIPIDIIRPAGHKQYNVSATPLGATIQITDKDITQFMGIFWADVDTVISFDESFPIADFSAGDLFLPANVLVQSIFNTQYFSYIANGDGKLHVNTIELWDALITEVQNQYG